MATIWRSVIDAIESRWLKIEADLIVPREASTHRIFLQISARTDPARATQTAALRNIARLQDSFKFGSATYWNQQSPRRKRYSSYSAVYAQVHGAKPEAMPCQLRKLRTELWNATMSITRHLNFPVAIDNAIMQSHYEVYKGWKILVEISGNCSGDDSHSEVCHYAPRIVVTEQLSIGFKDLGVETELTYPTPERCIQGGVATARKFIDGRI